MEKRALSWQEFLDSGFDGRDYNFPDFEGTFEAEMVCKRWDKNSKLLVYLDFDDGRKIITSAWQDSNYKGLADIPFNTRVRVWEMNEISYETEEKTETVIVETDDGEGNIIEEEVEETTVYLYITVSHKTVEEMMEQYGFTEDQKAQVDELLAQDSSMWASVLYGIYGADDQIVAVALSQLGNVGGEPYWRWYGFGSRVEWCACFVSWCADQCGYIETGICPKYAGCVNGVNWFKDRGQWAENDIEPAPGMIIFFDWDNRGSSGPQDGQADHVGIVQKVENGIVYTIEGNSGDSCRVNQYPVGHYEILGYGVVAY